MLKKILFFSICFGFMNSLLLYSSSKNITMYERALKRERAAAERAAAERTAAERAAAERAERTAAERTAAERAERAATERAERAAAERAERAAAERAKRAATERAERAAYEHGGGNKYTDKPADEHGGAGQPAGQILATDHTFKKQAEGQTGTQQNEGALPRINEGSETLFTNLFTDPYLEEPSKEYTKESSDEPEDKGQPEASDEGSDELSSDEKAAFIAGKATAILDNIYNQVASQQLIHSYRNGYSYQRAKLNPIVDSDSDSYYKSSKLGRMGKKKTTRSHNRIAKKKATRRTRRTRTSL